MTRQYWPLICYEQSKVPRVLDSSVFIMLLIRELPAKQRFLAVSFGPLAM